MPKEPEYLRRLHALRDGNTHYLSREQYAYFQRQPAALGRFDWNGQRWEFAVAGKDAVLYAFRQHHSWWGSDTYYAEKTDRIDPRVCGMDIEGQFWANPFTHVPGR